MKVIKPLLFFIMAIILLFAGSYVDHLVGGVTRYWWGFPAITVWSLFLAGLSLAAIMLFPFTEGRK